LTLPPMGLAAAGAGAAHSAASMVARAEGPARPGRGKAVVPEADVRRFEKENLLAALEATGGRVYGRGGAADLLGVKPTTLASRLKKLGIVTRS
jgi:transcriptional regulator with GAF, ATPase, and Fis domain